MILSRLFFYPELTDKMAMKIGKQHKSALVSPNDFDRFAADAAQTHARIAALAGRLLEEIRGVHKPHLISGSIAALINERCKDYESRFRRK